MCSRTGPGASEDDGAWLSFYTGVYKSYHFCIETQRKEYGENRLNKQPAGYIISIVVDGVAFVCCTHKGKRGIGMAVLGDKDLNDMLENDAGIVISNLRNKSVTAAGYDLTIGFICDADEGTLPEIVTPEDRPDEPRYRLLRGHRYLIISREYVSFPSWYMATLHSRASYVLKGLVFSSTTIDPNFEGFLYASLINCSRSDICIKTNNQFATMVIHEVQTPTDTVLQTNDDNSPRDAQGTLNAPFSNINADAATYAKVYTTDEYQKIKAEHSAARLRAAKKLQEKQDYATHARVLSEREAVNEQQLADLQSQINSLRTDSDHAKQTAELERKKRQRYNAVMAAIIGILLFVILYLIWGMTVWTVLAGAGSVMFGVLGGLADGIAVKEFWGKKGE